MDSQPNLGCHPPETLIAAYAIGRCSPVEQAEIDEHCFTCEECRTRLSILLRVSAVNGNEEERRQLERLFPLGMETIAQARQDGGQFATQSTVKGRKALPNQHNINSSNQHSVLAHLTRIIGQRPYQVAILSVIAITLASGAYYWYARSHSPVQNSLLAMHRSYKFSRPLEARVTGGFAYQPYERKRGDSENPDIDRDQINYALAELTRAVASHPTSETRHALGRLYLLLGDFDKAEQQMILALSDSQQNARLHTDLAALYYERSKYADPVALLTKAVDHYNDAINIEPQLAEAWFNRALCYEQMTLFNQARRDWEKYLEIDPNSPWANEARERLKKLQLKAVQSLDNNKNTKLAIEKAAESNDEAAFRQFIGQNFAAIKQYSTGQLFDDYLKASISGDNAQAESRLTTLRLIGQLTQTLKGDNYVSDLADFASRASPNVQTRMQEVRLMLRQADSEFDRSSYDTAFRLYKSAHEMAERVGDQLHTELAALGLFRYYSFRTQSLSTIGNQLISQSERMHHRQIQAQTHTALANSYLATQQIALALENSLRAIEIAKELGDTRVVVHGLRLASAAYARSGDYEHALNKDFEALSFLRAEPINPIQNFVAYHQVGETFFLLGNYQMALNYQQEVSEEVTSLNNAMFQAGTYGRLGLTLSKLGRNDEATNYLNNAISQSKLIQDQTSRQLLQAELYTTLGDLLLSQGKTDSAIATYQQAIQTSKGTNNRVYLPAIYQGLASAYMSENNISKAELALKTSISLAERDRQQISDASSRSAFLASRQNVYRTMVDLQFTAKRAPLAAFDYAEIAKSRNLLDTLSNKAATKWSDGRLTLSLSGHSHPLTLKQIQHELPPNTQILSYSVTEKRVIMWLITSSEISTASIDYNIDSLQKSISRFTSNIRSRRDIETVNRQATDLYNILIFPIAAKLDRDRLLCIIPDGVLSQLPFVALLSPENNHYLVEDFSITTNPSASILIRTGKLASAKLRSNNDTFIGISNPRFNYRLFPGLPSLPSAEEEVIRARSLYQQSAFFSHEDATKSELVQRIGKYQIVHIASHVLINAQSPLLSSILLAEEKTPIAKEKKLASSAPNGILQAQEVYQMKLPKTKLIILSGCRSALGDYTRSDALGVLAQSFFAAGSPSVIASLWDVDDASSAEIMYSFHYNHQTKHQGFGEALSQAQRSMLHSSDVKQRHPYYWAAFLLSGNGISSDASLN